MASKLSSKLNNLHNPNKCSINLLLHKLVSKFLFQFNNRINYKLFKQQVHQENSTSYKFSNQIAIHKFKFKEHPRPD